MRRLNKRKSKTMAATATLKAGKTMPSPTNTASRWVAMDFNNKIIAEGSRPDQVKNEAMKITKDFIIAFVPIAGATYVL